MCFVIIKSQTHVVVVVVSNVAAANVVAAVVLALAVVIVVVAVTRLGVKHCYKRASTSSSCLCLSS